MPFHGFDDKTICSDCLASEKFLASSYSTAVTESANEQLKRDFMSVYQDEQNCLKAVWDVMHTRGWYQLLMAHPQDVNQLQQQMQREQGMLQQRLQGGVMGAQMGAGTQAYQSGIGAYNQMGGRVQTDPGMGQYRPGS